MPAGDFTPSVLPDILVNVDDIFNSGRANREAEFKYGGHLVRSLMENQTVAANPVLERGDICKAVNAYFVEMGSDTVTYDGTVVDPAATCDPGTGVRPQSESVTYDVNSFTTAKVTINDRDCDNMAEFAEKSAVAFMRMRKDILQRMNERAYGVLNSQVQANQSSLYDTTAFPAPTVAEGNYLGIGAGLDNEDTLVKMEELIYDNAITDDYRIVNLGNNFWNESARNSYKAKTDDQNDLPMIADDFPMYWDRELYTIAGSSKTLLYNPNNFLFYNTTWSDTTPVMVDPKRNKYAFKWSDPVLRYRQGSALLPVEYEVRYVWDCIGQNSNGMEQYAHTWEFQLVGVMDWAPAGFAPLSDGTDTHPITGVLGFKRN